MSGAVELVCHCIRLPDVKIKNKKVIIVIMIIIFIITMITFFNYYDDADE